jgi:DNA polymerase I-like protein with 3'-5' exonuclease and polymerase domains
MKIGPNLDRKKTLEWFKDICESPATKIFHNAMYDVCWIRSLGIKINGLIIDTMIASSLIDENRFSYTLNTLSWHHLSEGKNEARLNEAAKERGLDPKADMWRLPAMEVGAYGEKDAELTLKLWHKIKKIIVEDDLQDIFNLETDLFPLPSRYALPRGAGRRVQSQSIKNSTGSKRREPIATNKNRNRIRYSINGSQKYFKTF